MHKASVAVRTSSPPSPRGKGAGGLGRTAANDPKGRKLRRRRLLAGAAGFAAAGLAACSSRPQGAAPSGGATSTAVGERPQTGGILNVTLSANPPSLDPHRSPSAFTSRTASSVYSRLFRFKTGPDVKVAQGWELENELAVSAETADGTAWTVKLRPGATFHNVPPVSGHAVEAQDIKATFTRALDPANPNRGLLEVIDPAQIQTPARDTVVFKLKYPYAPFPRLLAAPLTSWIFPREALAGSYDPARTMIGSGPFVFESYQPDIAFSVKQNPSYFEHGLPYLDGVRYAIVADPNTQVAQFSGGNLDWVTQLTIHDRDAAKNNVPKLTSLAAVGGSDLKINLQLGDPNSIWQDIRLRRALSMALDRDALAKLLFDGKGVPGFWVPAYFGKWSLGLDQLSAETAQYYKYDPQRAKQLLAEAGHPDLEVKIPDPPATPGGPTFNKYLEQLPPMLQTAGIKAQLVPVDYQRDFMNNGKGIFYGNYKPDTIVGWFVSAYADPDQFLYIYFDSKSPLNMQKLSDPDLDRMIDKSRKLLNDDERLKAYHEIETYIADKMYGVSLMPAGYLHQIVQPHVHNFSYGIVNDYGTEIFQKAWVAK